MEPASNVTTTRELHQMGKVAHKYHVKVKIRNSIQMEAAVIVGLICIPQLTVKIVSKIDVTLDKIFTVS